MSRFCGKVVIVTGSSGGIGRATALLFAKERASVTLHGRKVDALKETKDAILAAGGCEDKINIVVGDITNKETHKELIESTVAKFGRLDVLVNNAGAAPADPEQKQKFEMSMETYQKTMDINVNSVIELVALARPHLIAAQGEIINISSVGSLRFAFDDYPYYAMAKAALDQFTRALAVDLINHGVRVNCVNPGIVVTKFINNAGLPDDGAKKFYESYINRRDCIPIGEPGQPENIATVIAFLAHRPSSYYIIGQCIVADGGSSLMMTCFTTKLGSLGSS